MNRIKTLFQNKQSKILNIYTTAGFPNLSDTIDIVLALNKAGVDIIELGMPFSDPMADGETIQQSSSKALKNGMTLELLFDQVKEIRKTCNIPIVLMGYLNQWMQYGENEFLKSCKEAGVDGLIIPDLPMDIYENNYKTQIENHGLGFSFLVTPQTSDERIIKADKLSNNSFLYVVSQASITGGSKDIQQTQIKYFQRLKKLELSAPRLIGFGIHDKTTFDTACQYANGAIIGSAFIRAIDKQLPVSEAERFISTIK